MPEINEVTYTDERGKMAKLAYIAHPVNARRERFCQLMAYGDVRQREAYCQAYAMTIESEAQQDSVDQCASRLMHETDVILRIQELRKPLVRKMRRKFEYTLQRALEQCETAWDLAYAMGDAKSMLAAIRMQADLSKLLSQQIDVTHRYGVLDDASTEVLLAMRKELEVRQGKQKKLREIASVNVETVTEEGAGASFVVS